MLNLEQIYVHIRDSDKTKKIIKESIITTAVRQNDALWSIYDRASPTKNSHNVTHWYRACKWYVTVRKCEACNGLCVRCSERTPRCRVVRCVRSVGRVSASFWSTRWRVSG